MVLFCVVARDVFVVFAACFDFASVFCFVLGRQRDGSPAGRFARGRFARGTVRPRDGSPARTVRPRDGSPARRFARGRFARGRTRCGRFARGRFARGRFARRTVYPGEPVSGTVRMGRFARANRLARMIASALRFWLGAHAESRGKPCGSKTYCQKVVK